MRRGTGGKASCLLRVGCGGGLGIIQGISVVRG